MYLYEVHLQNGRSYEVTTPNHHDNHADDAWKAHMVDLLEQLAVRVAAGTIVRIIFRGRAR